MATVLHNTFTIQWEDIDTEQTLKKEFSKDISRLNHTFSEDGIWIRQNGESIYMKDMNDEHVINALRWCKRNFKDPMREVGLYPYLLLEAIHRGLMKRDVGEWDADENK